MVSANTGLGTLFVASALLVACGDNLREPDFEIPPPSDYQWQLPPDVPAPAVPVDNPMTVEKVELGRHLFYDTRLSGNQTQSCGSCHEQERGFADGKALPTGSTGDIVGRNSTGLMNVAYYSTFTWMNPNLFELNEQILIPIFGEFPTELGVVDFDEVLDRLRADPVYEELYKRAFPEDDNPFNLANTVNALASFVRSMVSFRSPYDRYVFYGEEDAMSASAKRGLDLFLQEELECHHCHGNSVHLSLNFRHERTAFLELGYANTGLYNLDDNGAYPAGNEGLSAFTGLVQDNGAFRSPSLRNIAVTEPYMHDGSMATLDEVLDHYSQGGRNVAEGPNAGDGRANPHKSEFVHGFPLTAQDREDLKAFFEALTDEEFLVDPAYADPFVE